MSNLLSLLHRLLAALVAPVSSASPADAMSLHDWADLPVHHPNRDAASN